MKNITLRLEDDLHKKLRIKMAVEEQRLQEFIVSLIEREIESENYKIIKEKA